jgi:hypothetical protein
MKEILLELGGGYTDIMTSYLAVYDTSLPGLRARAWVRRPRASSSPLEEINSQSRSSGLRASRFF